MTERCLETPTYCVREASPWFSGMHYCMEHIPALASDSCYLE